MELLSAMVQHTVGKNSTSELLLIVSYVVNARLRRHWCNTTDSLSLFAVPGVLSTVMQTFLL